MAASGRMDKVREAQESPGLYSPVSGKMGWGEGEPPREMTQFASGGREPSPALNRWSGHQHYPPGTAVGGEDGTPLRTSFQRDDVGPGDHQVQDRESSTNYARLRAPGRRLQSSRGFRL
jgi:hypothetical protein